MSTPVRFSPRLLAATAVPVFALLVCCGYVGEPLPPSLNIPSKVTDLAMVQRGDKLVIDFSIPGLTTDGVPLKRLGAVDLRVGPQAENWADQAKQVPTRAERPGPVHVEVPAQGWAGRELIAGVRIESRKGRFSDWSNLARLRVVPPLAAPAELRAESDPKGVRLSWRAPAAGPGLGYRVYRLAENEKEATLIGETQSPEYVDATAQYGNTYRYSVEAVLKAGESEAQSIPSAPVTITPKDQFPPAVPSGLSAVATPSSIEVNWTPNSEPDLKGYYLYRSADGGPFERLGDLLPTPSCSDRDIQAGKRYRYAVSAVDQPGNESARSAPVEAAAQ